MRRMRRKSALKEIIEVRDFFCEGESKLFLLTVQFHEKKNYFFPKEKVSENIDGVEMISFNSLWNDTSDVKFLNSSTFPSSFFKISFEWDEGEN